MGRPGGWKLGWERIAPGTGRWEVSELSGGWREVLREGCMVVKSESSGVGTPWFEP